MMIVLIAFKHSRISLNLRVRATFFDNWLVYAAIFFFTCVPIINSMERYCLTLDLQDDPTLIAEYEDWHQHVWPEILESITGSGIEHMQIYRYANRLFMIMEVDESFSFEAKGAADAGNTKVQEWETLMWKYQKPLPGSRPGEKWMLMDKIFDL